MAQYSKWITVLCLATASISAISDDNSTGDVNLAPVMPLSSGLDTTNGYPVPESLSRASSADANRSFVRVGTHIQLSKDSFSQRLAGTFFCKKLRSYTEKEIMTALAERERLLTEFDKTKEASQFVEGLDHLIHTRIEMTDRSGKWIDDLGRHWAYKDLLDQYRKQNNDLKKKSWFRRHFGKEFKGARDQILATKNTIDTSRPLRKSNDVSEKNWNLFAESVLKDVEVLKYFENNPEVKKIQRLIHILKSSPENLTHYLRDDLWECVEQPRSFLSRMFGRKKKFEHAYKLGNQVNWDLNELVDRVSLRTPGGLTPLMIAATIPDVHPGVWDAFDSVFWPDKGIERRPPGPYFYNKELEKRDSNGLTAFDYAIKARNSKALTFFVERYRDNYPYPIGLVGIKDGFADLAQIDSYFETEKKKISEDREDWKALASMQQIFKDDKVVQAAKGHWKTRHNLH